MDSPGWFRQGLLYLVAQVPAGAILLALLPQARNRPVTAVFLLLGYEACVALAGFVKTVWEQELRADAQKACAAGIRSLISSSCNLVRSCAPGLQRRYFRQLVRHYGLFNDRGLGLINANRLDLAHVFVQLRIAPSPNPKRANLDPLARFELANSRNVWEFLRALRSEGIGLAIIGAPGSGKTTLLQHVLLTYASNKQWRRLMRARVPVILYLRDHAKLIAESDEAPSLPAIIEQHLAEHLGLPCGYKGWFERRLQAGQCVVMLDGLDEVADEAHRGLVSEWVDDQITRYAQSQFVLTARPYGYQSAPLERAHVLEVQPFDAAQVESFIHSWYLANEIVSSGNVRTRGVRQRAANEANALLRRLARSPALYELTANPLLLTMVAMVHRYHGALPGSRVQLYAEICQVLLERWRAAKHVIDDLRGDQKTAVLRPLAAHMMETHTREIDRDGAMAVIGGVLDRVGLSASKKDSFLDDLQWSSGLLLERESGTWGFAHLSFQEYLCAAHWLATGSISDLSQKVANTWWFETLRLYAAQGDATDIVERCLTARNAQSLALAWDCLDEAREVSLPARHEAERCLVSVLYDRTSEGWRAAAEASLSRRLSRDFISIDEGREIGTTHITHAEYQLFLDDLPNAARCTPDHWVDGGWPPQSALDPVSGLRFEDAALFCSWLTMRAGGQWCYRLPRVDELQESITTHTTKCWCTDPVHGLAWCLRTAELAEQLRPRVVQDGALRACGVSEYTLPPVSLLMGWSVPEDLGATEGLTLRSASSLTAGTGDTLNDLFQSIEAGQVSQWDVSQLRSLFEKRPDSYAASWHLGLLQSLTRPWAEPRGTLGDLQVLARLIRDEAVERSQPITASSDSSARSVGASREQGALRDPADAGSVVLYARTARLLKDIEAVAASPESKPAWWRLAADWFLFSSVYPGLADVIRPFDYPIRPQAPMLPCNSLHWTFRLLLLRAAGELAAEERLLLARQRSG